MNDSALNNYKIFDENPQFALVKLGKSVLGGNEALHFTQMLNEISTKNVKYVIVDLKQVETMNSSGMGMLVSGLTTLKKHNIEMQLVSVPSKVMYLLKMTHLNNVFKTFDSINDALIA